METSFLYRFSRFLFQRREFSLNPVRNLREGTSRDEISLYFMLVAFFYLTYAIGCFLALRNNQMKTFIPPFLRYQPWLFLFLACWLAFWSFILRKNYLGGVKGAKVAALIYITIIVFNGTLFFIGFRHIIPLFPFIAEIAMLGITAGFGIFLALICCGNHRKINKEKPSVICNH